MYLTPLGHLQSVFHRFVNFHSELFLDLSSVSMETEKWLLTVNDTKELSLWAYHFIKHLCQPPPLQMPHVSLSLRDTDHPQHPNRAKTLVLSGNDSLSTLIYTNEVQSPN